MWEREVNWDLVFDSTMVAALLTFIGAWAKVSADKKAMKEQARTAKITADAEAEKAKAEAQKTWEEIKQMRLASKRVEAELTNNGGKSVKDAIDRIERNQRAQSDDCAVMKVQIHNLGDELRAQDRGIQTRLDGIVALLNGEIKDRQLLSEQFMDHLTEGGKK